jgi:cysteine sulfinate desulfinase/cysteine desulfurase-like protein
MKGAYLNTASTDAKRNGRFNPSDLAYPQTAEARYRLETLKIKLLQLINAPIDSEIIFNSGSTESIANCIFWAKSVNPHSVVSGSDYDHSAVKDNCDNYDMEYVTKLQPNTGAIFITHVNSRTGEICDVADMTTKFFVQHNFLIDDPDDVTKYTFQYRPLIFLDAAQSITKVPIDMERWKLDAVFFSLHKIGGPQGLGILIINPNKKFKPLIAGAQQKSLRGGTIDIFSSLENENIFEFCDTLDKRIPVWESFHQKLLEENFPVYTPKGAHLYNTILISTKGKCPLGLINYLANKHIYVGNVSACANEKELDDEFDEEEEKNLEGGNLEADLYKKAIRITFSSPEDLNEKVMRKIILALKGLEG